MGVFNHPIWKQKKTSHGIIKTSVDKISLIDIPEIKILSTP